MATFLDVTGLAQFSKVFLFILVMVVAYAVIANSHAASATKWIYWIIAFILGIFVILSDLITNILKNVVPWVGLLLVFVMFLMIAGKNMGASMNDYMELKWILLVVTIIIFTIATAFTIRQSVTAPGDIDEHGKLLKEKSYVTTENFIFHPTFIGVMFILLVGIFTVALLAGGGGPMMGGGGH